MRGVRHDATGQQTPAQFSAVRRIGSQLQTEHHAPAANAGDVGVATSDEPSDEAADEATVVDSLLGEVLIMQHRERRPRTSDGQRIPPEGGTVIARLDDVHHRRGGQKRRQRNTTAHVLTEYQSIRPNAVALEGEVRTRASETRLDLVEHQRNAVGVAELTHRRPIAIGSDDHAALGLHRFHQEHDGLVGVSLEHLFERREVTERHTDEAGSEGTEVTTILWIGGHADDRAGATVEVPVGVDDDAVGLGHVTQQVRRLAHHLDGSLDGLSARGHGKHCAHASEQGQVRGPLLDTRDGDGPRGRQHTGLELGTKGGHHDRVSVASVGDAIA